MITIKASAKKLLNLSAAKMGRHRWPFMKNQLLILGYHRILPPTHPEFTTMQPGMVVDPEVLRMHVRVLKKYFDIIDLNEWVERVRSGEPLPKKACALTFDDGWVDNYTYAFPVLKEEGVPATIFLVTSMIGTTNKFWPERVTDVLIFLKEKGVSKIEFEQQKWLTDFGLTEKAIENLNIEVINEFINRLKVLSDNEIHHLIDTFNMTFKHPGSMLELPQVLNMMQINEMMDSDLVKFASHTQQHLRLTKKCTTKMLEDEVVKSRLVLESMLNNKVTGLCYPNGDFDERSLLCARGVYDYACTTKKGWNNLNSDMLLLNRILIHNDVSDTPVKFEARISGFL